MEDNKFTKLDLTLKYGMEGVGDMEMECLTEEEQTQRWKDKAKYIQDCKDKGIYGEEYTMTVRMHHDPILDAPTSVIKPTTTYSCVMWDVNKEQYEK